MSGGLHFGGEDLGERGDGDAGAFQFSADLTCQLDGARGVPMQQDGVGDDGQVGSGHGFDEAFADHPDGAVHDR